jgi:hypothetical protein
MTGNNNRKQKDEEIITHTLGPGLRSIVMEAIHYAVAAYVHVHAGTAASQLGAVRCHDRLHTRFHFLCTILKYIFKYIL